MDRVWQWVWDRFAARYSWASYVTVVVLSVPVYLTWSLLIVGVEGATAIVEAVAIGIVAVPVLGYLNTLPGVGSSRCVERWAAGSETDRAKALRATYTWTRAAVPRMVVSNCIAVGLLSVIVGAVAGAPTDRLIGYAVLGAFAGTSFALTAAHGFAEAAIRPARVAIAGDTGIGDDLPRSRPTFAAWSNVMVLAGTFSFAVYGAMLAAVFGNAPANPVLFVAIGCALTLVFGVPYTLGMNFAPSVRPIRDLTEGTERVAAGDYSQRLPVVHDDDLGTLTASFNRMQAGLVERQRLQVAFGTYVDPALAARLLEQGDDVFTGERREVTVMFIDVRDFTPYAEANTAEDTVTRLNTLFEIVVPVVVEAGGHINKFLGDGALAVFGAPNDLTGHADAALNAAVFIQQRVAERFAGELRIGIGINTGPVIAGTIGAAGKLEFTLIGDTVNVAARVEQLTKTTGDAILLTEQTVDALAQRPPGLVDRGVHPLKGKSAELRVFTTPAGACR
ncbi:HAMP domain-containing protein [Mycolicibacterium pulveris]|uniref:Adenylate cyclase n=1 Tax=Mycolicibacterium pulveris TaxID=36813 RepID=A0A7I7UGQ7_MYCPV|nr:adenylate/guanylate cyclase domain-containing protein [Mycolicibacterium pulveris]MCV6978932.1 HAMP domain-containing protein [Mycolicibacterium pulveris]BBY79869.1 hypothetical protein MPUL_10270 [Mycolicibacterium pulveris]